jgi:hypothetical protein
LKKYLLNTRVQLRPLDMLHWRARRRAEKVIDTLYSPAKPVIPIKIPDRYQNQPLERLGAGIPCRKGAEPIEPNSLTPEDGIVALDYLSFCWSETVYQQIIAGRTIPPVALEEARRRSEERREKIDLGGRVLHRWEGKNLATDIVAAADVIGSTTHLCESQLLYPIPRLRSVSAKCIVTRANPEMSVTRRVTRVNALYRSYPPTPKPCGTSLLSE